MPSQYRPQLFGWIGDLEKGKNYLTSPDERLIYASDNYCAFKRKTLSDQIFYLSITGFLSILLIFLIPRLASDIISMQLDSDDANYIFFLMLIMLICFIAGLYAIIPEFYHNLFSRRGSPIIFNRKTGKVYINESYFFNFRILRNPLTFLYPNKRRVKEYDWADLHGVAIHNYSPYSLVSDILMVCKPGTTKTIDHIMLDPIRKGVGSHLVWGWVNNYMIFDNLADLSCSTYPSEQEAEFKKKIIKGQRWPEWMVEAFNATSLEELAEIKQKYHVKP